MSGGGNSLDDGLSGPNKTHEFRLRVGSVNVTSMGKRENEVMEMVARQRLDFCCIQESRLKGEGAKVLGSESMNCKFFWLEGLRLRICWSWCHSEMDISSDQGAKSGKITISQLSTHGYWSKFW